MTFRRGNVVLRLGALFGTTPTIGANSGSYPLKVTVDKSRRYGRAWSWFYNIKAWPQIEQLLGMLCCYPGQLPLESGSCRAASKC